MVNEENIIIEIEVNEDTGPISGGTNGKDGISPTINVKQENDGYRLTITDINGTRDVLVKNGENGKDGIEKRVTIGTYGHFTLEPNTFYHFTMDKLNGIAVEFGTPTDDTVACEYHFMFSTYAKDDGTCGTILDLPETVKIPSDFKIEASKIYEISILEGCMAYQSWDI